MATTTTTVVDNRNDPRSSTDPKSDASRLQAAIEFAQQAERLGQYTRDQENGSADPTQAVEAHFVTPQDPVLRTANGGRLPAVPLEQATKLNQLRNIVEDGSPSQTEPVETRVRESKDRTIHGLLLKEEDLKGEGRSDAPLGDAKGPWKTNPLFPPLPLYGPPTFMRKAQCWTFRVSSGILSVLFLLVIVLGAAFTSLPGIVKHLWLRLTFRNPGT